jgi:hypothetical protein
MEATMLRFGEEELPVDHDELVLLSLGYKQEFKREFSFWTTFCVSFAVLGLLPSFASTLYYGMGYAGTPGMLLYSSLSCVVDVVAEYWAVINIYSRDGLGMDNRYGFYPMCRPELG